MLTREDLLNRFPALGEVEIHEAISSTNDRAIALAKAGAPHLTLVLSDSQSVGRGRGSRSFFSPPGTGVYYSILVRPRCAAEEVFRLTLLAAVATSEAIEEIAPLQVSIKWVNDLWVNGRKVTGILTEGGFTPSGDPAWAVIGIGVNVGKTAFPPALEKVATSLENEAGRPLSRDDLICHMTDRLLTRLAEFPHGNYLDAYRARSCLIGATVEIARGEETYPARVLGIGDKGELLLDRAGERIALSSGEIAHVTFRPETKRT